jgi:signal transduction histidine kinase
MQNFLNFVSKYLLMYITIFVVIIILDIVIFAVSFNGTVHNIYNYNSPVQTIQQISDELSNHDDSYYLGANGKEKLLENNIWSIIINNEGKVIWSFQVPDEVPSEYSVQDIALFSKGYLCDYPVFIWNQNEDLLILGYPKDSYTKFTTNYLPYSAIEKIPIIFMIIIAADIGILFVAYYISKRNIIIKATPILDGIDKLSSGGEVTLSVKGELSEIGKSINKTSLLLKKQDQARANWISGVSHDIRTPLSMIMGYADTIANAENTNDSIKEQAGIIQNQSMKIRDLVQDLNLVSQLEYNMQQLHKESIYLCKLLREIVTEYLNHSISEKFNFELLLNSDTERVSTIGDTRLIYRAIQNLISNSMNHNSDGCTIIISLSKQNDLLVLTISDNGKGISKETLNKLNTMPHYLKSTDDRLDLRHGLGLLIVKEIVAVHKGEFSVDSEFGKGFTSTMILKCEI